MASRTSVTSPDGQELKRSLARLKTERVDLLQLAAPAVFKPGALPAVIVPPSRKTGFNLPRASIVASGRLCSFAMPCSGLKASVAQAPRPDRGQPVEAPHLEHLTPAQTRAFNIADNRLTETASWNDRLLGEVLAELSALDMDFSIEATGFSMAKLDLRIEGLSESPPGTADPADEPHPLAADPVTSSGDLWQLGRHRLFCGSALERSSYQELMREDSVDLVFTDPPFNVKNDSHATGNGSIRHREFAMAAGEDWRHLLVDALRYKRR